jgi:hypothetical protein
VRQAFPKAKAVQPNELSTMPHQVFHSSFCKSHSPQQLLQKPPLNQTGPKAFPNVAFLVVASRAM